MPVDYVQLYTLLSAPGAVIATSVWHRYTTNRDDEKRHARDMQDKEADHARALQDKQADHARALRDGHREDLRAAYAQLTAAEALLLRRVHTALELVSDVRSLTGHTMKLFGQGDAAKTRALESEKQLAQAQAAHTEGLQALGEALHDRDVKAMATLLLEGDIRFTKRIGDLMIPFALPLVAMTAELERCREDLNAHGRRMWDLIDALKGRFAPESEPGAPMQLPTDEASKPEPKQITASSEREK